MSPARLGAALAAAVLAAACTSGGGGGDAEAPPSSDALPGVAWTNVPTGEVARGGTLRLATPALAPNLNPAHSSNGDDELERVLGPTHGSAVRVIADGQWRVDADYARSVKVVDRDPLTVEVKLNPDAVWQDGTPITAADMAAYWRANRGTDRAYDVRSTTGWSDISDVRQGSDRFAYTVTFARPTVDWPRYVYPGLPASAARSAKTFNGFTDRAVPSNGPYVVTALDRERGRITMAPNPRWWGDRPRLTRILWQAATPEVQLKAFEGGELDAVEVPPATATRARDSVGDDLQLARGTEWTHLTMNAGRGPLKDVRVRRAVALALDRTALARLSAEPYGARTTVLGSLILLPGQQGYDDQSDRLRRDQTKARSLLAEAGWKDKPLRLTMPVPSRTGTSRERARMIADQLGEVGIEVRTESVPDADFFTGRIIPLDFDLATFTHMGSAFPVVTARSRFSPVDSPLNFTGTENAELDAGWAAAIGARDARTLAREVQRLDRRLLDDPTVVPLGVIPQAVAVRPSVVNLGAAQFATPDWAQVGFRTDGK